MRLLGNTLLPKSPPLLSGPIPALKLAIRIVPFARGACEMRRFIIVAALVAPTLGACQTAAQRSTASAVEQCESMGYQRGTELFLACANQQVAIDHDRNVRRSM